jgi:type I restriction enzyme, R subunit
MVAPRRSADNYRLGNVAIHENRGTAAQALLCLKLARELGIWLYRTFTPDPAFFSRSFRTPELPSVISAELAAQAEALRAKVAASETAAAIAAQTCGEPLRRPISG